MYTLWNEALALRSSCTLVQQLRQAGVTKRTNRALSLALHPPLTRVQCSYDWTLAPHIYNLFLPHMNLNGELRIDLQRVAHSTRTARVYKTEWSGNGLVAVKVLVENALPDRILQLTVRECWTWAQLQHENIVPLWGIADLQKIAVSGGFTQLCMVSPWMEQGNIMEFLKENPTANRLRLLWDIVKGVEYLHSLKPNKIVHGDLKGNNVLVDISDGGPRARLTDFGLSYAIQELNDQIPSSSTSTSYRGNPRWMAFERVLPKKFGAKNAQDAHTTRSDVFELMRTFLEVLTGLAPFHTVSDYEITQVVVAGKNPERPQSTQDLDEYMWRLMGRSWDHDRNKRPPLSEIWDIMECAVLRDAFLASELLVVQAFADGPS
ncbi:kinase-like protein [Calocera cornea HHB12733]|uniref:Kinase-like protein n=1 Tax=Calocera cornea HHB12733 TaxID=1353952 RepID=A0A165D8P9_9BASI|nr:kinase-like protein [Calocera cornea HHB12733]